MELEIVLRGLGRIAKGRRRHSRAARRLGGGHLYLVLCWRLGRLLRERVRVWRRVWRVD